MNRSPAPDQWAAGSTYEQFMGRWSRELAREFVRWLEIPSGKHWLDVGCGTGALTSAICAQTDPLSVVACDPSAPFIEYARAHAHDPRVSFVVADAEGFPIRAGGYDSITSLLAFNFLPDLDAALARMRSAASPNAVISACVWDYAGEMQFLRYFWDAAIAITSAAHLYDEGVRFPVCNAEKISELFRAAGLIDIRHDALDINTDFASFDDYWQPLLGGTGPAPSFVASLDENDRARLRRELETSLPSASNGTIALRARAWTIAGSVR